MNKKRRKILLITLAIAILFFVGLLIFIGYFKKHVNSMPPKIMLLGEKIVILDYGNKYNEEGFKASFRGKDVSDKITVSDNIDLDKLGTYYVDYSYTYKLIALSKTISRTVVVTDTKSPELTVESEDKISIPVGSDFKIDTKINYTNTTMEWWTQDTNSEHIKNQQPVVRLERTSTSVPKPAHRIH